MSTLRLTNLRQRTSQIPCVGPPSVANSLLARTLGFADRKASTVESAFRAPIATVAGEDPLLSLAR